MVFLKDAVLDFLNQPRRSHPKPRLGVDSDFGIELYLHSQTFKGMLWLSKITV